MIPWHEREPEWFSPTRELLRLKRRAQARWLLVVVATVGVTVAALYKLTRPPESFRARVMLRVTESDLLRDAAPLAAKGLGDYLLEAALPTAGIIELLEKHDLMEFERSLGAAVAANEFRASLDVAVYRNYFAISRGYAEGARTARVSIRFTDSDPDRALEVARDAAELMAATEAQNRRRSGEKVARIGRFAADQAEERLAELEEQLAQSEQALATQADPRGAEAARLRVEVGTRRLAVERQTARVEDSRWRLGTEEFREAVASSGSLGVDFAIVDERPAPPVKPMPLALLGMLGTVLFVVLFPLVAIAIAAFDRRVHDVHDVTRLGLPVFGTISRHRPGATDRRVT